MTHTYAVENTYTTIVFDFGGVIAQANTSKMANFLMHSFYISRDELLDALNDMQDQGDTEEHFWKQFTAKKQIILPVDWMDQFGTVIKESIHEIPRTLDLVKELKAESYQTAILSDMTQYQAEMIQKMGYFDLFTPVVLSYENRVKKPNPRAFQLLLKKLNEPASFVIFIDDRIENVEAAKNQGIDAIHFINATQLKEELEKRGFKFKLFLQK